MTNIGKDELFDQRKVFEATDDNLDQALFELSTGYVPNDMVKHREIIRAITINSIKNQRHIDRIERRNEKLTYLIILLTVVSIILSVIQIFNR